MYRNEREREIMNILTQHDYMSVKQLSSLLFTSESSIRRDLTAMEIKGLVRRTYGGVEIASADSRIIPFATRLHHNIAEKKAMAKKALAHILNKHAVIVSVLPESINIKFTDLPGKKVPVRADIIVEPREDYTQNGALIQSQDSVMLFSDAKTLNEINEVYTYHVKETDLTDTLRRKVMIAPLNGAITEPRSIDIMVPIEKLKTQTRSVKIVVRNAPVGVKMLLFPSDIDVTYRSPVSRIKDDASITLVVDYNSLNFNSNSNMVKVMIGEAPAAYQDMELSQDSVEYIIERSR